MTNQSELERLLIQGTSYNQLVNEYGSCVMCGLEPKALLAYITDNYTPNSKLKALIKESEKWNKRMHGRPDCKSCALQEQLAELIENKENE